MITTLPLPGVDFSAVRASGEASPLRSDVAGFAARTCRGPLGRAVRVVGERDFARVFGALKAGAAGPRALRAYFDNGGEVAWIVRVAAAAATAQAVWVVGDKNAGGWDADFPLAAGFRASRWTISATSPGAWANGLEVEIRYRRRSLPGEPEIDLEVTSAAEPREVISGLRPGRAETFEDLVGAASVLVRLAPIAGEAPPPPPAASDPQGPRRRAWRVRLADGATAPPDERVYRAAADVLCQQREVALVAFPDLHQDLGDTAAGRGVLAHAVARAEARLDRLVLADVPLERRDEGDVLAWISQLRAAVASTAGPAARRTVAVYHPAVRVTDALGVLAEPLTTLPPSGAVAGLVSRLDRERGAHHTPANARLFGVVDVERSFTAAAEGHLYASGVNLVRCFSGRGLVVWGGRTLSSEPSGRFVAHRRLIHRLVRGIRRVAEPLVFDVNGPELWLTLVRAVTSVLLEAFRAGALKGQRPEEGFRVRCDAATNPPEEIELGRVYCEIDLAPATPMEFITLRVALGREGELEVFES